MTRHGGPYEHRLVREDDPAGELICRVCGYMPGRSDDAPGCPQQMTAFKLTRYPWWSGGLFTLPAELIGQRTLEGGGTIR